MLCLFCDATVLGQGMDCTRKHCPKELIECVLLRDCLVNIFDFLSVSRQHCVMIYVVTGGAMLRLRISQLSPLPPLLPTTVFLPRCPSNSSACAHAPQGSRTTFGNKMTASILYRLSTCSVKECEDMRFFPDMTRAHAGRCDIHLVPPADQTAFWGCILTPVHILPDVTSALVQKHKQLQFVPDSIGSLSQLTWLELSHNEITMLPPELGGLLPEVGTSRVTAQTRRGSTEFHTHHSFTAIIASILVLASLTQTARTPHCTVQLLSLHLRLHHAWPVPDLSVPQLESLHLAENFLTQLPESIGRMSKLGVLQLRANRLTSIPTSLINCTGLFTLDLSQNRLTSFGAWPEESKQVTPASPPMSTPVHLHESEPSPCLHPHPCPHPRCYTLLPV